MGLIGAYYDIGTGEVQFGKLVVPETFDELLSVRRAAVLHSTL
jgi:hypothetical protein